MARPHETVRDSAEDGIVLTVLVLTLAFLVFMMSVPIWFTSFVRGLTG